MAVDDFKTEYHLTPNGWIEGTTRFFSHVQKHVDAPTDRLLTVEERVYQSSGYSPEEISSEEIWRRPGSDKEIAELLARFPPPYRG